MKVYFFRVADNDFGWLWESWEDIPAGYSGSTKDEALDRARALSADLGNPVELWSKRRMNDYVGPPVWGDYQREETLAMLER